MRYEDCVAYYAIKRLNADEWSIIGPRFHDTKKFCTKNPKGEGVCLGDAGAPLVVNGMLIGLASWTEHCAVGSPDVYINVFAHLKWIRYELTK